jgi:N-acetylglucosamine kinase-like BadF-type ATPase
MRVLGMDIGGTRSRARLAIGTATADVVAESEAPSASLTAAGLEQAGRSVAALLAGVGLSAEDAESLDAICVGSAGSGSTAAVGWLVGLLAPLARGGRASVGVVNDSLLALPAAGLDEGIAVICGTGSTAVGVRGSRVERAGGWGYLLGDEGSGYWITREAVRELVRRSDDHEQPGALGAALLGATGLPEPLALVQRWHQEPNPAMWASLAPAVLDCDDSAAKTILEAAARSLARLAAVVAERLAWPAAGVVPVVLAGGLVTQHPGLALATRTRVERTVGRANVQVASEPPVAGAVRLAVRLAEAQRDGARLAEAQRAEGQRAEAPPA